MPRAIVTNASSSSSSSSSSEQDTIFRHQDRRLKVSEGYEAFGFVLISVVFLAWCFGPARKYCCRRQTTTTTNNTNGTGRSPSDGRQQDHHHHHQASEEFEQTKSKRPSIEVRREALMDLFERCKVITVRPSLW